MRPQHSYRDQHDEIATTPQPSPPPSPQYPYEIITARVIPADERRGDAKLVFRNVEDSKIGFARNAKVGGWEGVLREGDRVTVKLSHASQLHYRKYNYWLGDVVGKLGRQGKQGA